MKKAYLIYSPCFMVALTLGEALRAGEPPPADPSPSANSSSSHSIHRTSYPFLRLGFDYSHSSNVADTRLTGESPGIFDPLNPDPRMSITQMKFYGLINLYQNRQESLSLGGGVPIRTIDSTDPSRETGSEMGGYETYLDYRFMKNIESRLSFAQRQSPKLYLYDNHPELSASLTYEFRNTLLGSLGLLVKLGPQFVYSKGSGIKGVPISYGLQYGGIGDIILDMFFAKEAHFRLSTGLFYRQISSYKVQDISQGAASIFTFSPSFDYRLLEELWIGAYAEIPSFRPENREASFGNSEIPGLYGRTVGLRLRVMAL